MGGGNNELQAYLWNKRTCGSKEAIWSSKPTRTTPTCLERRAPIHPAGSEANSGATGPTAGWTSGPNFPSAKEWPAIWMLPTEEKYGGWASSGEIDIMELVGHEPSTYHGTLHYGGGWPRNKHTGKKYKLASGTFADDFHVFSILWEKGQITWAIDGKPWQTQKNWYSEKAPFPAPFDQRFHLVLNLAVGGRWPGNPNAETKFPAKMLVDYVRVYQAKK